MEAAVAALVTERNLDEAAKAVGISPTTLLTWMKAPEFQAALRAARRAAFSQALARLQQASTAAVTTLLKIMLDQNAPPACKVRAAVCVLEQTSKALEIEDIEARIAELERSTGTNRA
jgi:hypothetical protein